MKPFLVIIAITAIILLFRILWISLLKWCECESLLQGFGKGDMGSVVMSTLFVLHFLAILHLSLVNKFIEQFA